VIVNEMKKKEVIKILEENKITNVIRNEPKIIHTKEFHCDDDHPIVYYVVDENNEGICEYCSAKFLYKEKDFYDKAREEKELLDMSMKESIKQKEERTDSINKILKGSG
tara:strand:+ start:4360 stop:4686 length:327 start_codon:yes stop_codon:yes gene_type:complete